MDFHIKIEVRSNDCVRALRGYVFISEILSDLHSALLYIAAGSAFYDVKQAAIRRDLFLNLETWGVYGLWEH